MGVLKDKVEALFPLNNDELQKAFKEDGSVISSAIEMLDRGQITVCEKDDQGEWVINEWVKKAILLYFRTHNVTLVENAPFRFIDKIPLKQWSLENKVRVVPQALARYGSFVDEGAVLMPSYVNIGAYVGKGSLIDTWATVGSCAYVGGGVHVSGGVGIGGVLEPLQASPVIIEDNCFIGSRCILVEGVRISEGAVLGAGVTITGSTKILDVSGSETKEYKGFVPKNSVVIPGTQEKQFPAGKYNVPCALIIGQRKESTDKKTSLNDVLREYQVSV